MVTVEQFAHLAPAVRAAAALPADERFRLIRQERWIAYRVAKEALGRLEELLNYPPRARMPNLLLFGPTNNGKTKIIRKFMQMNAPKPEGEVRITPVVMVEMPPQPGLGRLYAALLDAIGAPYRKTARSDILESVALDLLRRVKTRMLIIDEIHNLLACNATRQRQVLNQLKYLGNQLQIPIIGVGTEEAWSAVKNDPQLANRFDPYPLPLWSEGDDFLQLLISFGRTLPLRRPSNLLDERFAKQVLARTDGSIGEISRLIERAAIQAIEDGTEHLTLEVVSTSNYRSPSERRMHAEIVS